MPKRLQHECHMVVVGNDDCDANVINLTTQSSQQCSVVCSKCRWSDESFSWRPKIAVKWDYTHDHGHGRPSNWYFSFSFTSAGLFNPNHRIV